MTETSRTEKILQTAMTYQSTIRYHISSQVSDSFAIDDIYQEVIFSVWRNAGSFNPEKASFRTWLTTITRNKTIDYLRSKRTRKTERLADLSCASLEERGSLDYSGNFGFVLESDLEEPSENAERIEEQERVRACLEKLSTEDSALLELKYQGGYDLDSIGRVIDKPTGTIKSALYNARRRFKKEYEKPIKNI